jgi:hypothetical protein
MKNKIIFILITAMFIVINSCSNPESSFNTAKEKNTIESYTQFINKFPNHIRVNDAKKEIEKLKFKKLMECLNADSLASFIKDNSNSLLIDSAKKQLLKNDYYQGVEIKSELMNYKDLCDFNPALFHLSCSRAIDGTFTTHGCEDMVRLYGHPPVLKLSIFNKSGSSKTIELKGFSSLKINRKNNKTSIPEVIGLPTPNLFGGGDMFGFTVIEKGSISFDIPDADYIDLAFICPEISKEDLVILNNKLIAVIK